MQEYGGEALVLRKEPQSECDSRVSLYMKRYGKLVAKAKSARKITSKLSAHLEPGNISEIRLVEKNDLHVVDALKKNKLDINPRDLYLIDRILSEADPDPEFWRLLSSGRFNWNRALSILGWDPKEASCSCGLSPRAFDISKQEFFCKNCVTVSRNIIYTQ